MFVPAGGYLLYDPTVLEAETVGSTRSVVMSPTVKTNQDSTTTAATFSIAKLLQERAAEHRNGFAVFRGESPPRIPKAKKATCIVVTSRQRSPTPNSLDQTSSDKEGGHDSPPLQTCVPSRELKFGVERILADRNSSPKSLEASTGADSIQRPRSVDTYSPLCPSSYGMHPLDHLSLRDSELANRLSAASYPTSLCHCPYDFISPAGYGESPLADQFPIFGSNAEAAQLVLSSSRLCHPAFAAALLSPHQVPATYISQGGYSAVNSTSPNHSDSRQLHHPGIIQPTPLSDAGGATGKRKRSWSRAVFSNLQRKGLEKRFVIQKYITKPDRRQLAATLGLTDAQVKVWFQNRRMKWRHSKEYREEMAKTGTLTSAKPSEENVSRTSGNPAEGIKRSKGDVDACTDLHHASRHRDTEQRMSVAQDERKSDMNNSPITTNLTRSLSQAHTQNNNIESFPEDQKSVKNSIEDDENRKA